MSNFSGTCSTGRSSRRREKVELITAKHARVIEQNKLRDIRAARRALESIQREAQQKAEEIRRVAEMKANEVKEQLAMKSAERKIGLGEMRVRAWDEMSAVNSEKKNPDKKITTNDLCLDQKKPSRLRLFEDKEIRNKATSSRLGLSSSGGSVGKQANNP